MPDLTSLADIKMHEEDSHFEKVLKCVKIHFELTVEPDKRAGLC